MPARAGAGVSWGLPALSLGLLVLVYWPAMRGHFLMSDVRVLLENTRLLSLDGLLSIWSLFPDARYPTLDQYQPLTYSLFWVERQLFGAEARAYQAVGLALHATSAWLVWRLLRRLSIPGAGVAALIFMLHAVQVESVAWIYEQKNLLSGVFFFLTLHAYLDWERERRPALYGAALGLFALALLAKPTTVILPALIVLYMWYRRDPLSPRTLAPTMPFFALSAVMAAVTIWYESNVTGASGDAYAVGLVERAARAGVVTAFHAGKIVWPADLSFFYPRVAVDAADPLAWWPVAAITAGLGVLFWKRDAWGRPGLLGVGWYLGLMFPVMGFFHIYYHQYSFYADHFQYLPSLGPIALAVSAASVGLARMGLGSSGETGSVALDGRAIAGLGAVALMAFVTWQRSHVFANDAVLARDATRKYPQADLAWLKSGEILLQYAATTPGDHRQIVEQAVSDLERAVELRPEQAPYRDKLGAAYSMAGRLDEARAQMETAVAGDPDRPEFRQNLAVVLEQQGEAERAALEYRAMVRAAPERTDGYFFLGRALMAADEPEDAREALVAYLDRADPGTPNEASRQRMQRARQLLRQLDARLDDGGSGPGVVSHPGAPYSVLLLTIDTLRPDHLGTNGFPLPTSPALDALIEEGLYFEQALTPVPRTTPALASLLTGAYPHSTGVRALADRLPAEMVTLAEALGAGGYQTIAVVTNLLLAADDSLGAGFEVYDAAFDVRDAERTTDSALAYLDAADGARPMLLWVHYIDPHVPYHPDGSVAEDFDPGYRGRFRHGFGRKPRPGEPDDLFREFPEGLEKSMVTHRNPLSDAENEHIRRLYSGEIRAMDEPVARLVERFRERFPRSVIVFASDHGESLGEHDFYFDHGDYVYNASARVPLAFILPAEHPWAGSGRLPGWVSLVDVAPTLFDVLGVAPPPEMQALFEGRSLAPALQGAPLAERPVFIESGTSFFPELVRRRQRNDVAGRFRAVVLDDWKLVWTPFLPEESAYELYDLASDPDEERDLYRADHPRVPTLRAALDEWRARDGGGASPQTLSESERDALRRLGYIE